MLIDTIPHNALVQDSKGEERDKETSRLRWIDDVKEGVTLLGLTEWEP